MDYSDFRRQNITGFKECNAKSPGGDATCGLIQFSLISTFNANQNNQLHQLTGGLSHTTGKEDGQ
jgi:hypothetical protein